MGDTSEPLQTILHRILPRTLIPSWSPTPIPNLSLSAGGLLALADLNTIAQRTAITGGSSWLDALVLAPGLHYQQAADALDQESVPGLSAELGLTAAIESRAGGGEARYNINNIATVNYLKRLWADGNQLKDVTLNVKMARVDGGMEAMEAIGRKLKDMVESRPKPPLDSNGYIEIDWLSHLLYLSTPLLTASCLTLMVLLEDWWGLGFIIALMISRMLNIWVIKKRSQPAPRPKFSPPAASPPESSDSHATEYTIDLGAGRRVRLRGLRSDLQALTTQTWLRSKTNLDGYLEAIAKLIVYLIAAFSGNLTQAGAMVLMVLLLTSAGLLGLSNAHAKGLQMHGRVVRPQGEKKGRQLDQGDGESAVLSDGYSFDELPRRRNGHAVNGGNGAV